jgi:sigma-B regulation protein RsbU (phosphoserine phosphatase)
MFGKDALRQLIRENADKSADLISRTITAGLASFRGGHPQEDDVTLVVIKVLPC